MSPNPAQKRNPRAGGTTGVKILVTAASLTAVLAGWAGLTVEQTLASSRNSLSTPAGAATDAQDEGASAEAENPAGETALTFADLSPIPTLVPEPTRRPVVNLSSAQVGYQPGQGLPVVQIPPTLAPNAPQASGSNKSTSNGNKGGQAQKPAKPPKPEKPAPVSNTRAS